MESGNKIEPAKKQVTSTTDATPKAPAKVPSLKRESSGLNGGAEKYTNDDIPNVEEEDEREQASKLFGINLRR